MSGVSRTPSLRRHKPSGLAIIIIIDGKDHYLGPWPAGQRKAAATRDAYERLVAEWLANGWRLPFPPTPRTPSPSMN